MDSDQVLAIEKDHLYEAKHIPTSMMEDVGDGLYRAPDPYIRGSLTFENAVVLGVKEGDVGFARDRYYGMNTPDDVWARVDKMEVSVDGEGSRKHRLLR